MITEALKYLAGLLTGKGWGGVWHAPDGYFENREDVTSVFEKIYRDNMWGRGSGGGSLPRAVRPYQAYLVDFLKHHSIASVVDLGCGDWQFSRFMDWSGIHYLGIDVVESVVKANQRAHATETISFRCLNVLEAGFDAIPSADLFIAKDVLQHLSSANAQLLLRGALSGRFRYALITNDYASNNVDIPNGDTRPLDLRAEPFSVTRAEAVLEFRGKATFLIECREPDNRLSTS